MQRRLFFSLVAAAALTLLSAASASAAIRVTISDGVDTKVFYSPSSNIGVFSTDLGAYDVFLQTTFSNYPGQDAGGVLSQTVNLSDSDDPGGSILPTLTITADIIEAVSGLSMGQVTGSNLTAVNDAALAFFTLPSGPTLTVSSDVSSAEPASQAPVGTVQNTTTVNGVVIDSLAIGINSTVEAEQQGTAANTPSGYTLSSTVTLTGAASGTSGLAISASSAALAPEAADIIPEPATMVVWGFGAIGLLWTARRRLARSAA